MFMNTKISEQTSIDAKNNLHDDLMLFKDNFSKYENVATELVSGEFGVSNPLISIIIPTFNRDTLKDSILSVIEQDCDHDVFEIIVIDNNPDYAISDRIIENIKNSKILHFKNKKNIGAIGNWNRGIELARGEWLCFLHDDDLLQKSYISNALHFISITKNLDGILMNAITFGGRKPNYSKLFYSYEKFKVFLSKKNSFGKIKLTTSDIAFYNSNLYGAPTCGAMLNRQKVLDLGGFDEDYYPPADYVFFLKYNLKFNLYKPNFITGYYRWEYNDTFNENTLVSFVEINKQVRNFFRTYSNIGRIMYSFFDNEFYLRDIYILKSYKILDLEYLFPYVKKRNKYFKFAILKFILKIYFGSMVLRSII